MDNHPVPQNISSYEFRLVGDMTLKQFLQLAGGLVVALIFIRLPILAIIKWPLAFLSALLGVLMAFVPINGRPFTDWLSAFFKAIYSPTQYVWRPVSPSVALAKEGPTAPPLPAVAPAKAGPQPALVAAPIPVAKVTVVPPPPWTTTNNVPSTIPRAPTQTTSAVYTPISPPKPQAQAAPPTPPPPPKPPAPIVAPSLPRSEVGTAPNIVRQPANEVGPAPIPPPLAVPKPSAPPIASAAATTNQVSAPTTPNIVAGMVTDSSGNPLSQTTVEIIDLRNGIPARALRTNRLGQFQIAIPLPSGKYNLIIEKEGLNFDPVSIEAKGLIVPPVIIQAHAV